ncbi:hypothetical protein B8A02_01700 [Staphylococcus aureus]|nr:hypothetical protein B8A02_01700 [Staphylococcus aureus]
MKRLKNFILGLLIVVIVGFLLFMYIQDGRITEYQDYFLQFEWFQPLLISLAALLILIGLILVFSIFKPTHRKPGLYKDFDDGHVYVSRKAVEKTAFDTVAKYDQVRQPNVVAKLYNKKNKSYIDIKTDFFVPNNVAAQYLLGFNSNIKERVKYIALYDSMPKPNRNKRIVAYIVCSISSFT